MNARGRPAGLHAGKPRARRQAAWFSKMAVMLLALLAAVLAAGCGEGWFPVKGATNPSIQYRVYIDSTAQETTPPTGGIPTPSVSAATSAGTAETGEIVQFQEEVKLLLQNGLEKKQKEISLDTAISLVTIPEPQVKETIDQIFKIYQSIYFSHPEYFYLNGSVNISYSLLKGDNVVLKGMTVKPLYWVSTSGLTGTEIDAMVAQVEQKAESVADEIRAATDVPWQQLQLLHDYLVREVRYDTSGDVENNQAAAALLKGLTLCQGYAQSFQMIAFKLGFECLLISGKTNDVGHVWNLVRLGGIYYHVDVTHDDPTPDGGSGAPVEHIHFLRSDSQMRESHVWETADYPAAPDDGAQYYRQNNLTSGSQKALNSQIRKFCGSLDFTRKRTRMLELLYTGSDIPTLGKLEKMISDALSAASDGRSVQFRYQISKSVVDVEITTGS